MAAVLLATDADWLFDDVSAALCGDGTVVSRIHDGNDLREAVTKLQPDLTILDMQTGSMGAVAGCRDLRLEAEMERVPATRVLLLLDRDADRWIAREAGADGWMIKPLNAFRLRRAANAILAGEAWFEGEPKPALELEPEASAEPVESA